MCSWGSLPAVLRGHTRLPGAPLLHPVPFAKEGFVVASWGSAGAGRTSAPLGRAAMTPGLNLTDFP